MSSSLLRLGLACCLPFGAAAAELQMKSAAEVAAAIAAARPGDTLVLRNGTYTDLVVDLTCQGTAEAPITFRAETPGGAVFTRDARIRVAGNHILVRGFKFDAVGPSGKFNVVSFEGAHHSRLTQSAFFRCGNDKWRHIVKLGAGTSDSRVDHNYFERLRGQGIGIAHGSGCANNLIDHNWLNRTEGDGGENNGFEPIQLGQGGKDTEPMRAIVEYNLIENMFVEDDADPELISVKTGENTIRYNTFRRNSPDRCLTLRSAANCVVEGNFLFSCYIRGYGPGHRITNNVVIGGSEGIHLPGGTGKMYARTNHCLIAHNTVINPLKTGIELGGRGPLIDDIRIENNIVVGGRGSLYVCPEGVPGVVSAANLGFNTGQARVAAGVTVTFTSDPLLDPTTRWRMTQASPARDAGAAVSGVMQDIDGEKRDAKPDLGADEYSTAPGRRRPLTPADVGPDWSRPSAAGS